MAKPEPQKPPLDPKTRPAGQVEHARRAPRNPQTGNSPTPTAVNAHPPVTTVPPGGVRPVREAAAGIPTTVEEEVGSVSMNPGAVAEETTAGGAITGVLLTAVLLMVEGVTAVEVMGGVTAAGITVAETMVEGITGTDRKDLGFTSS